jgi:hypothetical protein
MADSDKDILITPNTGAASDPSIVFSSGATGGDDVTLNVTDDGTITTLSFEGSAGQLFSITNDLTGTIFSVNDISGIPSLEVNADGTVSIAEFDGDVGIGTSSPSAQLHVIADSATTNADIPVLRITATSTGTPATGIGPSIEFESETAAGSPGNLEVGGVLALESTDVTATTEDFDFVFSTMAAGAAAAERMRITSTGNVTATSFGGITEANLLDKTATETVSGTYTFSNRVDLDSGFEMPDASAYIWNLTGFATWGQYWNTTTNAVEFHAAGAANVILDVDGGNISVTGDVSGATIGGIVEAQLLGSATTHTLTNKTFDANGTGNSLSNVDVADLANGTDGELITWDATGAPATVATGTSGHVLTSNGAGAAPTFQAAAVPTTITVADESADTTCFPLFVTAATGDLAPKSGSNLTFNSAIGDLQTTSINLTGTGTRATASLQLESTSPAIYIQETDATANEGNWELKANADTFALATASDADAAGENVFVVARTGTTVDSTTFNGTITADNLSGTNTGDGSILVADESADTTCFPVFVTAATGTLAPKTGSNLTFNSNTGDLSATSFGGITEANLVDKTATETISGSWNFTAVPTVSGGKVVYDQGTLNGVDFDTIDATNEEGVYTWTTTGTNSPFNYGALLAFHDSGQINQLAFGGAGYGQLSIRRRDSGVWYDWCDFVSVDLGHTAAANRVATFASGTELDSSANLTFDGTTLTLTGQQTIAAGTPAIFLDETDAAADESLWRIRSAAAVFSISSGTDAAAYTEFFRVTRSGGTPSEISLRNATTIELETATNITGAVTIDGGDLSMTKTGAQGDTIIKIEADSDNAIEASNAILHLAQDGEAVHATFETQDSGNLIALTSGTTFAGRTNVMSWAYNSTAVTFAGSVDAASLTLTTALDEAEGGTGQSTYATGDILYASAANTLSKLAAGTNTHVLTLSGGVPTWAAPTGGGLSNIVEDTTPQLGGQLDMQTFNITGDLGGDTGATTASLSLTGSGTAINAGSYANWGRNYSSAKTFMSNNTYVDSGDVVSDQHRYAVTHASYGHTIYEQAAGQHTWFGDSASVTAGNVVTKQTLMTLTEAGNLTVNGNIYPGGQTLGYIRSVTGNYGSVQVAGADGSSGSYAGISVDGKLVMMTSGTTAGIYDDTNNTWKIRCDTDGAGIALYYGSVVEFETQNSDAAGNTSGAYIQDHGQVSRDVGFNDLRRVSDNPTSFTVAEQHMGGVIYADDNTAFTVTLPSSTSSFPVGGVITIINANSSAVNITVADQGTYTCFYLDPGGGRTDIAASATIARGGVATIWRAETGGVASTPCFLMWGSGITP